LLYHFKEEVQEEVVKKIQKLLMNAGNVVLKTNQLTEHVIKNVLLKIGQKLDIDIDLIIQKFIYNFF
jgi:hypothetical protein